MAKTDANDLQDRLADRERLVAELTSRLEQAAEQLDRMKRTGADRGGRGAGSAGLPPELIERQQSLTEDLHHAVQQWEDMQPTVLLSRVEMQVAELRDLIVEGLHNPARAFPGAHDLEEIAAAANVSSVVPSKDSKAKAEKPKAAGGGMSSYEAFKAGLLDPNDADANSSAGEHRSAKVAPPTPAPPKKEQPPQSQPTVEIPSVDAPSPVDFETADIDDLRTAVDARDTYIAYLSRRLRAAESSLRPSGSWSDLENVPDELRARLEEHERDLDGLLRVAEVETSLERARLAREASRLETLGDQLRKKAVQLGIAVDDPDASPDANADEDSESAKKNGRWFRLFGK